MNIELQEALYIFTSLVESATPPLVDSPVLVGNLVLLQWDHTSKGPCFNHLTFSYNITWYQVGNGTGQVDAAKSAVISNSENSIHQYIITNLFPNTSYQVEIVGFTSTSPRVYSEPVTVEVTTQGKTCIIYIYRYSVIGYSTALQL